MRGRGRFKPGKMNKTESRYALYLESLKNAGKIEWYEFEAIKLRLAAKTFYNPDFLVMKSDGELEVHEVKGFWEDDARVKIKVAASKFPFKFLAIKLDLKTQGWVVEEF